MTAVSYPHIITEIKQLSMTDQLRLLEEMAVFIRERSTGVRTRSIFELKGRGKDIWKDIDAQKYIDGCRGEKFFAPTRQQPPRAGQ